MYALEKYVPKKDKHIKVKDKLLNNVKRFYEGREKILKEFKNWIFLFDYDEELEEEIKNKKKKINK